MTRKAKLVEYLLTNGADANAKDNEGKTPLARLLENSYYSDTILNITELLLNHGADVSETEEVGSIVNHLRYIQNVKSLAYASYGGDSMLKTLRALFDHGAKFSKSHPENIKTIDAMRRKLDANPRSDSNRELLALLEKEMEASAE